MIFSEVAIIDPDQFTDYRGDIWTVYKKSSFPRDLEFKHDKYSSSRHNVLRGIHGDFETWKLVSCIQGELYFVVVNNRKDSPTYKKWDCMVLDDRSRKSVLLPPGFGNGFYVLSDTSVFSYKLSYPNDYNDVDKQFSIKWNDPELNINWPCKSPILQERDM